MPYIFKQSIKSISIRKILTLLLLQCAVLAAQAAEEKVVNFYNWADYIAPQTIADFEKEYGIRVNYDIYDTSEIVDAKLLAGKTGYDVVVHAASFSARLIEAGIYRRVDKSKLSNWQNLDPVILQTMTKFDPGNHYAVPYTWGTTGIAFNIDMLKQRMPDVSLATADFFFKPEILSRFADCGVSVLDSSLDVLPMAMDYLGYKGNSIDPQQLRAAVRLMKRIRPYIKYFNSAKLLIDLPNKEVCVAMSWSGDYSVARRRAAQAGIKINIGYAMLKNAVPVWFDAMFIPADAPHPNNAHLLINYLLRPQVMATISNFIGYANANRAATPLVDPKITSDPGIYPDEEVMRKLELALVYPPKLERARSRAWTRIKSGL